MTSKFISQAKRAQSFSAPSDLKGTDNTRDIIRNQSVFTTTTSVFPKLDDAHRVVLSHTLEGIFNHVKGNKKGYTPFKVTPEGSVTHPQTVVNWLQADGAVMVKSDNNNSAKVTINSISDLSGISKGSLASVNTHNQHLSAKDLEKWRKALAAIGDNNPDNEEVHGYAQFGESKTFLANLLTEWRNLVSTLPIERIREWADKYCDATEEQVAKLVESYRPTHKGFLESMVKVWRDEYEQGKMEDYTGRSTLLDVLQTRTASQRMSRAFNTMIRAVHDSTPSFNRRISLSKTNYPEYKRRYGSVGVETGLTSEALMGYCFFLGINPISMLHWLAYNEWKSPGTWECELLNSARDMLKWKGTMSPVEYTRFHNAVHNMGLVSDQNRWATALLSTCWVYCDLPNEEKVEQRLGVNYSTLKSVSDNFVYSYGAVMDFKFEAELYKSPYGMALTYGADVFSANNSLLCLGLVSAGEFECVPRVKVNKELETTRDAMGNEEFMAYMRDHIHKEFGYKCKNEKNLEDYATVEFDGVGEDAKVVIADSYHMGDVLSQSKFVPYSFYTAIKQELDAPAEVL
ncbi:hypothetical protein SIPHO068v1_p0100 [Vibrio phage 51E28.4]|nr:hypothetical protein SIPHO068v1_p0100 [Vibrio phage 51E28.4]